MVIKIIEVHKNYNIIERYNVSRKGLYYQATYKDINGKEKVIERKFNNITRTQFEDNLNKVKGLKTRKEKLDLSRSYTTQQELNVRKKQEQKESVKEKFPTEKNYDLEKELSNNKLFDNEDRNKHKGKFRTESDYKNDEVVICLKVGSRAGLSNMSESEFRTKVKSYLRITGEPKGNQALFIDDLVNLWGVEFKK